MGYASTGQGPSIVRDAPVTSTLGPPAVFTDGMTAYPHAVRREFETHGNNSPHRVVPSIRAPESNNLVERLHGSEKDRIRPMRGFDSEGSTGALMEGFRVHYNIVRPHLALGMTPGEAAGLSSIPGFRWREIIRLATRPEGTEAT